MLARETTVDRGPVEGSRREQAKGERRARIVKAAYDLLREVSAQDMSMKALAARAGVSLSTVYNLFDSRQAILSRVFDQDLERFEQLVRAAPAEDALERIFAALDIAADLYEADPDFYRATMARHPRAADRELETAVREPRIAFWRTMTSAAVQEGWLRGDTDPAVVGALLIQITGGVLGDWVAGDISIPVLRREIKLGFAAALLAFAAPAAVPRLRRLVGDLHGELSRARGGG